MDQCWYGTAHANSNYVKDYFNIKTRVLKIGAMRVDKFIVNMRDIHGAILFFHRV